jgi:hypothetical protein
MSGSTGKAPVSRSLRQDASFDSPPLAVAQDEGFSLLHKEVVLILSRAQRESKDAPCLNERYAL